MQLFEILAACYETLMDSEARRRCDLLLQEQETAALHRTLSWSSQTKKKNAKVVGMIYHDHPQSSTGSDHHLLGFVGLHTMPSLAEVSSCASMDESLLTQDDDHTWRHGCVTTEAHHVDGQEQVEIVYSFMEESKDQGEKDRCASPATVTTLRPLRILNSQQSSWDEQDSPSTTETPSLEDLPPTYSSQSTDDNSSGNNDTSEIHYTGVEIDRMFGGPLQLLFRARRWKVFRDPFQVFAEVFGNPLYGNLTCATPPSSITKGPNFRSAFQLPPPMEKLPSEHVSRRTTVHRTRRVVGGNEIVRTAVVRIDPRTGQRHVTISVTRDNGSWMEEEDPPRKDWFHFLDSLCVGSNGSHCFCFDFTICT